MAAERDTEPTSPTELAVSGMTCGNCARHVTEALQSVPGVASAVVQLAAGRATVRWESSANLPAVVKAVKAAGYEAAELKEPSAIPVETKTWSPLAGWRFNVVVGFRLHSAA